MPVFHSLNLSTQQIAAELNLHPADTHNMAMHLREGIEIKNLSSLGSASANEIEGPALIKYFPSTGPWIRIPSPALVSELYRRTGDEIASRSLREVKRAVSADRDCPPCLRNTSGLLLEPIKSS
jgi:hypothetical protein